MSRDSQIAQARAALAAGDLSAARNGLAQLIRSPGGVADGEAWWLLAQTLSDPTQRADCLRRAELAGYQPPPAIKPLSLARPAPLAEPFPPATPVAPPAAPVVADWADVETRPPAWAALVDDMAGPPASDPLDLANPQVAFIIRQLGRRDTRDQIAHGLMERGILSYTDAVRMIEAVKLRYPRKTAHRKIPLLTLMALGLLVGGSVLCLWAVTNLLTSGPEQLMLLNRRLLAAAVSGSLMVVAAVIGLVVMRGGHVRR